MTAGSTYEDFSGAGRRAAGLLALILAIMPVGPDAAAQDADDTEAARVRLEALESELAERARRERALAEAAAAAGREAEALARRVVAAAAEVQALEERVAALAIKIDSLGDMLAEQEAALDRRRTQMARTLAALQRLTRRPTDLALLRPGDADETIKSALLLRDLAPQLEAEARAIGTQVARILSLREDLQRERFSLVDSLAALEDRRSELDALRRAREAERVRLLSEADAERRRVEELAARARDLEELLAGLEAERERRMAAAREAARRLEAERRPQIPPSSVPFGETRGSLPLPARGRLVRSFGETSGALHERGITIATLEGAQVIAPYDGRVAFAGSFRGYGQLLIIAHGEDYHTLLAGMSRIYASVGQWVLAGEPIGAMEAGEGAARDLPDSTSPEPELYIELRKNGEPVDPVPWLAAGLGDLSS